jgi:hypothetical protein
MIKIIFQHPEKLESDVGSHSMIAVPAQCRQAQILGALITAMPPE